MTTGQPHPLDRYGVHNETATGDGVTFRFEKSLLEEQPYVARVYVSPGGDAREFHIGTISPVAGQQRFFPADTLQVALSASALYLIADYIARNRK